MNMPKQHRLALAFFTASHCLAATTTTNADPFLEEVRVTAELRETRLQDQIGSTTVLGAAALRERAVQHLEEVLNVAPNVNYASGASRARYFQIRGVGDRSQFQEPLNPSVGVIVDGIDFSGLGVAGPLFDVSQVEVLRGPQGTLHGANALAGLINIRSAEPTPEQYGRIEAGIADYRGRRLAGVSSGPVAGQPNLLYRVAAEWHESDGFYRNDFLNRSDTNGRREFTGRARLRWLASERDTVDVSLLRVNQNNGFDAFSLDNTRRTLSDEPGSDDLRATALSLSWRSEGARFDRELNVALARTDTLYAYDEDWSFPAIDPSSYSPTDSYARDRDSASLEWRWLSNEASRLFGDSTDWVAGVYYLGNREDLTRRYTFASGPFDSGFNTDTYALFGQTDTTLSERVTLRVGLRGERRATRYQDSDAVRFSPSRDLWGGRVALEYRSADSLMWYGSAARGYRANGVNAEILANLPGQTDPAQNARLNGVRTFDEELLYNYEIGSKWQSDDARMQLRVAVFIMERRDQQVGGAIILERENAGAQFLDYTANAASGRNRGLEMEVDYQATDALRLYANLGLLDAKFRRYVNSDGVDLAGRRQAQAPRYQYAAGARYALSDQLFLRLDIEGKDGFLFSDRHEARARAYALVHARVGYDIGAWNLALWGRNLTNKDFFVRGFGDFGNDPRKGYAVEPYLQFGEPRVLGASVTYSF